MRNLIHSVVIISAILATTIAPIAHAEEINFSDVPVGHANYIPIQYLAEEGIVGGNLDGNFEPDKEVNRVEALKMILEALTDFDNDTAQAPDENPFDDTDLEHWYIKYLKEAQSRGMADGYGDGRFGPNDPVKLAESLKFTAKSLENYLSFTPTESPFADVEVGKWYAEYIYWAKNREMLWIDANNNVNPEESITKGYFASILYKLLKYSKGYRFGKATYYGETFHGRTTASGSPFDMFAFTAAHKELTFGTIVEVMNLANGETIRVEITDRGPYGHGRVLDLSAAAFEDVASLGAGIINAQYKIVTDDDDEETDDETTPDPYTEPLTQE